MSILPLLLYLFRSLPIPVTNQYFTSLSGTIRKFLCQGKKARFLQSSLIKHKLVGGTGLPDLKDYYWVTFLDQLKKWFPSTAHPLWVETEYSLTPNGDLYLFLMSDTWRESNLSLLSLPMQASLLAWRHLTSSGTDHCTPTISSVSIKIFEALIPSLSISALPRYGISKVADLLHGDTPYKLKNWNRNTLFLLSLGSHASGYSMSLVNILSPN